MKTMTWAITLVGLVCVAAVPSMAVTGEIEVDDLDPYLDLYATSQANAPLQAVMSEDDTFDGPPASLYRERTTPVVRLMPASLPGNLDLKPHGAYIWPGRNFICWGRVDGGTAPYTFEMDFGDGSAPVSGAVDNTAGRRTYYIAVVHAYATAGPKTLTLTVTDGTSAVGIGQVELYVHPITDPTTELLLRRNAAVQDGLRWLYIRQNSNGSWYDSGGYWDNRRSAQTAAALACFQLQGFYANADPAEYIYAETVRKGLNHLFSILVRQNITGPGDTNGDGYALHDNIYCGAYAHGLIMYAIALSREPLATAPASGNIPEVNGRTYHEILTNMVDQLAWSQGDSGTRLGGWRYNVCTANDEGDNSAVQWATIALDAAERCENLFLITAPAFVRTNLAAWLNYSRCSNGGYGYTSPNNWCNIAKTGSGVFSEYYCRQNIDMLDPAHDPRIVQSLSFMNSTWCNLNDGNGNCEQFNGNSYAMYAAKKALDDLHVPLVGTHDWYTEYCKYLMNGYTSPCGSNSYKQVVNPANPSVEGDGPWPSGCYICNNRTGNTCLSMLILIPGISCQLIAEGSATPKCPEQSVDFDGTMSQSTCSGHEVVRWIWDYDDADGADINDPDAVSLNGRVTKSDGYPLPDGVEEQIFHATLWIIDSDESGICPSDTASTIIDVVISRDNHAPIACLEGPFTACVGEPITLSACCSDDGDEGSTCAPDSVVLYEWDLGGNGSIDFTSEVCDPDTTFVFYSPATISIVLWVTDAYGRRSEAADADLIWASFDEVRLDSDDIAFDPPTPACGRPFEVCATVHAEVRPGGGIPAGLEAKLYFDEIAAARLICTAALPAMSDGDSVEICCTWQPPDSVDHNIIVVADAAGQLRECDETNNVATRGLECGCVPGESLLLPWQWSLDWPQDDEGTVRWYLGGGGRFDVATIDLSSILLNGVLAPIPGGVDILPELPDFSGPVMVIRFQRGQAAHSFENPGPGEVTAVLTAAFTGIPSQCLEASGAVLLTGGGTPSEVPAAELPPAAFQIAGIRPNPSTGSAAILFAVPSAGPVQMGIYDAAGRLVRDVTSGVYGAGRHTAIWDGRNVRGEKAPAGVYFVRAQYANTVVRERLVLLE